MEVRHKSQPALPVLNLETSSINCSGSMHEPIKGQPRCSLQHYVHCAQLKPVALVLSSMTLPVGAVISAFA